MINVVYACNGAYVRQTIVSIASLLKYNKEVQLYLIIDGITSGVKDKIRCALEPWNPNLQFWDIEQVLPELYIDQSNRHPRTIYAKLFLDKFFEGDYILYLDSDVIVHDCLDELFNRNMENEYAAGVMMPYSLRTKEEIRAYAGQPYICDGVVLFNMEAWRREKLSVLCERYICENHGMPPMLSEGTLNHVCRERIGILDPRYNLMPSMLMYNLQQIRQLFRTDYYYEEESMMLSARRNPVIIHFMNELYNRPWFESCEHPLKEYYLEAEREVYGCNELKTDSLSSHTKRTVLLRKYLPFEMFATLYHIKNKEW